jgi:feruloyl-CoA synthase
MPVRVLSSDVVITHGPGGVIYARSPQALGAYPRRLTDRLEHWAARTPTSVFLKERDRTTGGWRSLTYADALARVRRLAQALIDRGLSAARPIVILSGNSIEHALLGLAALYSGVPYAPISPPYSLAATRFDTLRAIWAALEPGLVFAAEGAPFERALSAVMAAGTEIVTSTGHLERLEATTFSELESARASRGVDDAHDRVAPSTVAKILFTSGSTGTPKGVINTQQMLCANQEQIRTVLQFLDDAPPVLCDWLPWHHTFGGNHNFGLVLYNGGTLHIDAGQPVAGAPFQTTVDNLREIAPTLYLNVPRGYELLAAALRDDSDLRARFFSQVRVLFCAAASVKQAVADELAAISMSVRGEAVPWIIAFGATESSPLALCTGPLARATASQIGVPVPGLECKIVPVGAFGEARLRGPNITPGYWNDPALTRSAFDEEGFYRLGDLVRFVDPARPEEGFAFEGRLNENFKLSTGTWVRVGALRQTFLSCFGDLVQDVVIAAPDREEVTALVFPNVGRCRDLAGADGAQPVRAVLGSDAVRAGFERLLARVNEEHSGSSTRIVRVALVEEPPSLDAGEITDKGSINQREVLRRRADVVGELYGSPKRAIIITAPEASHSGP